MLLQAVMVRCRRPWLQTSLAAVTRDAERRMSASGRERGQGGREGEREGAGREREGEKENLIQSLSLFNGGVHMVVMSQGLAWRGKVMRR